MDLFYLLEARIIFIRIYISILLLILYGQPSIQLSLTEGQDANLTFPYPCDSTEVTLQHGYKTPFYRLTSPQNQGQRLRVENRNSDGNCSLDLTISDVMRSDQGTYISSVYKDGEILIDETHRIWLGIEYPPGKATCVEVEGGGRGGDWTKLECTADAGSLKGKIVCYQIGEIMPSMTDPAETHATLTQIMIVRKSQPAFCCSSTTFENKTRCECNDDALNLDLDNINYPCHFPNSNTEVTSASFFTEVEETQSSLQTISTKTTKIMEEIKCNSLFIHAILFPFQIAVAILSTIFLYKLKQRKELTGNDSHKSRSTKSLLPTGAENGIIVTETQM